MYIKRVNKLGSIGFVWTITNESNEILDMGQTRTEDEAWNILDNYEL